MRRWLVVLVVVGVLLGIAFVSQRFARDYQPLRITLRIVDAETSEPIPGAVVAVGWGEKWLGARMSESSGSGPETTLADMLRNGEETAASMRVKAVRTDADGMAVLHTFAVVDLDHVLWFLIHEKAKFLGVIAVYDPTDGFTRIPVGEDVPFVKGEEPATYKLDLGTIRVEVQ